MKEKRKKVTLIAVSNIYRDKPYYFSLPYDMINGKEALNLSGPDLQKAKKLFSTLMEGEQSVLTNKKVYWLDDEKDSFMVNKIFPILPEVAMGIDEIVKGKSLFYIQDVEKEAESDVSKEQLILKAKNLINDMPENGYSDLCLFIGLKDIRNYTTNAKLKELFKFTDKDPKLIMKYFSKQNNNNVEIVWFRKLEEDNIVSKRTGNFDQSLPESERHGPGYYYNERFLGATESESINFVKKDGDLMKILNNKLQE